MSYFAVGNNMQLATSLKVQPQLHSKEVDFVIRRLKDISKHPASSWQKFLNQAFGNQILPPELRGKWPSISAAGVLSAAPASQRGDLYKRAGIKGDFYNYLVARWPFAKSGPSSIDILKMSAAESAAATVKRQETYASGTVKDVFRTDASGNKTQLVKDGQVTDEGNQFIEEKYGGGQVTTAGFSGKNAIIVAGAAVGLWLFLRWRKKSQ